MVAKLARLQRSASRGSFTDEPSLLNVGDVLAGKYRVARVLGEGGMGVVVEAHHQLLDQRVAVKLLYRDVADAEAQSRLLMEARAAAKLQSEHVARVVDVDVGKDGLPFIVMELLEGSDLCQVVDARGALPPRVVVDYILQCLEGLAHAHGSGIIHRDLKPSNLFLANKPDGSQIIKILDFGVSKSSDGPKDRHTQQLTGGHTMLGSPPYMSPEQVRSPKKVDHRTDIWALGICMYELLTNSMPFGGTELQETFAQILEKTPAPIHTLVPGVPEAFERVVMKCLEKDRDVRYSDVAELATAIAPFGSGTWTPYVERIQSTLMRALMEDEITSVPLPRPGTGSLNRVAIPGAPGRRNDSIQPELNGTASTVAHHRYTVFNPKRSWLLVGITVPAFIGLLLIAFVAFRPASTAATDNEPAATRAEPTVLDPPPPVPSTSSSLKAAEPPVVRIEGDIEGPIQGTVLGSSPVTDATSKPKLATSAFARAATAATAIAPPPRALPKPPAPPPSAKPSLPSGLPMNRGD